MDCFSVLSVEQMAAVALRFERLVCDWKMKTLEELEKDGKCRQCSH